MKAWLLSEIAWCAVDQRPEGQDLNHSIYLARSQQKNFRLAEILAEQNPEKVDKLQLVKSLLSRGQLEEAKKILQESLATSEKESLDFWELAFEQMRLFSFSGDWTQTIELATKIIKGCPTGITVMGAYQARSVAHTENGDFKQALHDIEKVCSFGKIYPKAFSLFYAEVQKAKLLHWQKDIATSQELRRRLWREMLQNSLDLDDLLTLCRLEFFCADKNTNLIALLRAQKASAQLMGDELYLQLAEAYAAILGIVEEPSHRLQNFERIQSLFAGKGTEAEALKKMRVPSGKISHLSPARFIFASESALALDLESKKKLALSPKQKKLVALLTEEKVLLVPDAFTALTALPFTPHLHGNYLSNLVYQLNKKMPGAAKIANGQLLAEGWIRLCV